MFNYKNKKNILITIIIIVLCFVFPDIKEPTLIALKLISFVLSNKKDNAIDTALIDLIILVIESF